MFSSSLYTLLFTSMTYECHTSGVKLKLYNVYVWLIVLMGGELDGQQGSLFLFYNTTLLTLFHQENSESRGIHILDKYVPIRYFLLYCESRRSSLAVIWW